MSYARFGWDGSDVYVFGSIAPERGEDAFCCCACSLNPTPPIENEGIDPPEDATWLEKLRWHGPLFPDSTYCATEQEMIDHLLKHREAGHTVPQDALDRLAEERDAH